MMFILAVAACARPDDDLVETRFIASPTTIVSPELSSIDSLMWRQPDSAFALLLQFVGQRQYRLGFGLVETPKTPYRDGVHTVST